MQECEIFVFVSLTFCAHVLVQMNGIENSVSQWKGHTRLTRDGLQHKWNALPVKFLPGFHDSRQVMVQQPQNEKKRKNTITRQCSFNQNISEPPKNQSTFEAWNLTSKCDGFSGKPITIYKQKKKSIKLCPVCHNPWVWLVFRQLSLLRRVF